MFKKKEDFKGIEASIILQNNMIDICTDACSICWDKPVAEDIETRKKYIAARIKTGHESIIEHSNLVMVIEADPQYTEEVFEVMSETKYMNISKVVFKNDLIYFLLGGSIRAYKHIFRNIENLNNTILVKINRMIYENCTKEFFMDFINDDIMKADNFIDIVEPLTASNPRGESDLVNIINNDLISQENLDYITGVFGSIVLRDIATVTILFKNMSRTGTHQLVRHRNAITQESQRYVDYSDADFASPSDFKDIYDSKTYTTSLLGENLALDEMGNIMTTVYNELREQDVLKEDARAFLPSNIKCKKLYMTFTLHSLYKFLELRTDKHAQAEIRKYATNIQELMNISNEAISYMLDPAYKRIKDSYQFIDIDEVVEEELSEIEFEEKDYE